ncbi:hypothetical protein VTK56DRAFT_1380 [Thermocarpiscus australiensis]
MKTTSILSAIAASAAVASAQFRYEDGEYICEKPNAAYCSTDSLKTDIIIRCNGTVGQPGRCTDNLIGEPPVGVWSGLCWESSRTSGDAACEKNCVVYGQNGTFTLPASECTPSYTATATATASASPSASPSATATGSETESPSTLTQTEQTTLTTTVCPPSETLTTKSFSYRHHNSTLTVSGTISVPTVTKSRTPTGPGATGTSTGVQPPIATGGAGVNRAAGALAVLGAAAAFLL